MSTKEHPGLYDAYNSALPDEPMFVLLARDTGSPRIVRAWANVREGEIKTGDRPPEDRFAVAEARRIADQMEIWRQDNNGRWRK